MAAPLTSPRWVKRAEPVVQFPYFRYRQGGRLSVPLEKGFAQVPYSRQGQEPVQDGYCPGVRSAESAVQADAVQADLLVLHPGDYLTADFCNGRGDPDKGCCPFPAGHCLPVCLPEHCQQAYCSPERVLQGAGLRVNYSPARCLPGYCWPAQVPQVADLPAYCLPEHYLPERYSPERYSPDRCLPEHYLPEPLLRAAG